MIFFTLFRKLNFRTQLHHLLLPVYDVDGVCLYVYLTQEFDVVVVFHFFRKKVYFIYAPNCKGRPHNNTDCISYLIYLLNVFKIAPLILILTSPYILQ